MIILRKIKHGQCSSGTVLRPISRPWPKDYAQCCRRRIVCCFRFSRFTYPQCDFILWPQWLTPRIHECWTGGWICSRFTVSSFQLLGYWVYWNLLRHRQGHFLLPDQEWPQHSEISNKEWAACPPPKGRLFSLLRFRDFAFPGAECWYPYQYHRVKINLQH